MQLIAGLGNPGEKYQDNPHNIGFRTLDQLMKALDLEGFQRRFNSEFQRTLENGQVTLMLKPETYMNRSGSRLPMRRPHIDEPSQRDTPRLGEQKPKNEPNANIHVSYRHGHEIHDEEDNQQEHHAN